MAKTFKQQQVRESAAAFTAGDKPQERRTERVQMVVTRSTRENLKKIAQIRAMSFNSLLNSILEEYAANAAADIDRFNAVYGEDFYNNEH